MLNLEETLFICSRYSVQKDVYLRASLYSLGVVSFIEILRGQVAEIDLLQLIPGFYLILVFFTFLLLVFLSKFFFEIRTINFL